MAKKQKELDFEEDVDLGMGSDNEKKKLWIQGIDDYLRECLRMNPEDIQHEYARIPSDLAYWNAQYAEAIRAHLTAKLDEKVVKANVEPQVRQALRELGGKVTEDSIKQAIEAQDVYIEAQRLTIETEVRKHEIYGYLDSIRSKRDMLVSLGAHIREEMKGDPLIRERERSSRVRDAENG